jgi:hypothetical protein
VKAADWRHFGRLAGFRNTKTRHAQFVPVPAYDEWRSQSFYRDIEGQWVDRGGKVHTDEELRQTHSKLAPTVRFPFVRLVEASGEIAVESDRLVATMRATLERERANRAELQNQFHARPPRPVEKPLKGIDAFRVDARYGGDGTRVDLAYAVYAVARGADVERVRTALRSRDLSHKGNEKRQNDYIERTIRKALATVEQGRGR